MCKACFHVDRSITNEEKRSVLEKKSDKFRVCNTFQFFQFLNNKIDHRYWRTSFGIKLISKLLSKLMQVSGLPDVTCPLSFEPNKTNRNNLTWSFTHKIEQRTFNEMLLDNNAIIQYARDEEGLEA